MHDGYVICQVLPSQMKDKQYRQPDYLLTALKAGRSHRPTRPGLACVTLCTTVWCGRGSHIFPGRVPSFQRSPLFMLEKSLTPALISLLAGEPRAREREREIAGTLVDPAVERQSYFLSANLYEELTSFLVTARHEDR